MKAFRYYAVDENGDLLPPIPVLGVSDEEVPSDVRLKIIKCHNNWLDTQHIIPIIKRGTL